ncbi:hypothetical protein ACFSCV_13385 [Methylopila henanensis]|uniref:ABC transporter substrate-binding protein n=1 Tax=Methylopila henanensis TaxID=873516 RepID=A0ABW4KBR4_9HYPH
MRLVFVVATLAFAAYASLEDVTYLRGGGFAGELPEHRRIEVVSSESCGEVVARAERTLGAEHGITCERVPLARHWANVARDTIESRRVTEVVLAPLRTEAMARSAADTLR